MSLPPPAGIYVPVPTFFIPKSSSPRTAAVPAVDLPTQASHALYLARSGIRGIVLLGSTGEAVHLTRTERTEVITFVRDALDKAGFVGYPLIAGTASNSIEETVEMLSEAGSAGAGWGLVLAPGFFAGVASEEGIRRWYEAVADRSPIPILIYHYPAVSNNVKLPPSVFRELSMHRNIVGGKLSHGDVSVHAQIALDPQIDKSHFYLFTGLGQQLFAVLQLGCVGAIDGLAAVFPKTIVRLYDLVTGADPLDKDTLAAVRELQYAVSCGEEMVVKFGTVGIKEAVCRVLGFGESDGGRPPLAKGMGYGEWERWSKEMTELARVEAGLQAGS